MKSENNNSFTIKTTDKVNQDYTVFIKEEETPIPSDRLVSGMSYWAKENILNYKNVENPFLDSVQFKEPQNPVNARLKAIYKETINNKNTAVLSPQSYYFKEEQKYMVCNPFAGMESLTWRAIEPLFTGVYGGLDVRYARDLNMFFTSCKKLKWCDVSGGLKVTKNTEVIEYFFSGCTSLKGIVGLTTWDIANITDMDYLFFNCKELEYINICTWDTSRITDFRSTFGLCSKLKKIHGVIDLSSVENYTGMFASCNSLTGLKLKNVPENFDFGRAGLTPGQYEIVDDPFYVDPKLFEPKHYDDINLIVDWGDEEEHL